MPPMLRSFPRLSIEKQTSRPENTISCPGRRNLSPTDSYGLRISVSVHIQIVSSSLHSLRAAQFPLPPLGLSLPEPHKIDPRANPSAARLRPRASESPHSQLSSLLPIQSARADHSAINNSPR